MVFRIVFYYADATFPVLSLLRAQRKALQKGHVSQTYLGTNDSFISWRLDYCGGGRRFEKKGNYCGLSGGDYSR